MKNELKIDKRKILESILEKPAVRKKRLEKIAEIENVLRGLKKKE